MKIFKHINEIKRYINKEKNNNKKIGFVPTMGALHRGHISLLERARQENDVVVCSIFVNPTQFNDKNDFINYPKTLKADIEKLNSVYCDVLFVPGEAEMYPESDKSNYNPGVDFGYLDKTMEGKYRPGHFNGVAIIVSKLFDIIKPDTACFGEKDYQQLIIIKWLVKTKKLPIQIIGCPIVREKDGLAMSSRNALLSPEQRKNAAIIYKILSGVKEKSTTLSVKETKDWVKNKINNNPFIRLEYFEIANSETLLPVENWEEAKKIIACVALYAGKVRLIDNIVFARENFV